MKWIIDHDLVAKMDKREVLFHKVLPFFCTPENLFVFALETELSACQLDFLEALFPGKRVILSWVEKIEELQGMYEDYGSNNGSSQSTPGLANRILFEAVERKASDIHFESLLNCGRIRLRVDGALVCVREVPLERWPQLVNRIKVLGSLRLDESKHPQMGRKSMFWKDQEIDMRFSCHPTIFGESIVVRILDKHLTPLKIQDLGFEEGLCNQLRDVLKIPYGLIIFTGPTGSGKTTTLFSLLNEINTPELNIMTLEDPVEYILEGAKQTEIKPGTIEEFKDGIRSLLRQDPDVVLIGEMRDEETAKMAFRAAMTGHKVFSTLHANTSFQVLQRLADLSVSASLISGNLKAVISQRLVRKVCKFCAGDGCKKCSGSGFSGRIPVGEALIIDSTLDEMIELKSSVAGMEKYAASVGFVSLKAYALYVVTQGITTLSEVEKVIL